MTANHQEEKQERVITTVPSDIKEKANQKAHSLGMSLAGWVRTLIYQQLD